MNLLQHNIQPYEQLNEILKHNSCACLVMGTGVGKSYITLEYLTQNNYKALIVAPRNSICDSWQKLCEDKIDTITYQKLTNIYKTIDYTKYNLVICDEVHHIGARKWSVPIRYLLDNNIKVLGLTESPVRYTDGGRDVAEEFFNGNVVFGESVPSAIEKGILNSVTYVGAMYNSDGLKKTLRGKIQSRLYAKLNLAINNTPTVKEILQKNMPDGKRKGIIFASTIDDIKFAIDFIHSVYPQTTVKYVHSKQSDAINEEIMEWFRNTDEGYICSVDMISEGVHIKGVNTLIMLRRTESANLFNQQLGRCLDASSKQPAILFDLVNNKYSIRIINNKLRIKTNSIFDNGKINVTPSEQLIVRDYTKDIVEVLKEIKIALEGKWTDEEINLLKQFYKNNPYGRGLKQFTKNNFPNRTLAGVSNKAAELGLKNIGQYGLFTDYEIQFIKTYYTSNGAQWVAEKLNRDISSIQRKASKLGVTVNNPFTAEQKSIIEKYYPLEGKRVLKRLPGTSIRKLKSYVHAHHIQYKRKKIMCVETGIIYDTPSLAAYAVTGNKNRNNNIINACKTGGLSHGYHWKYV